MLTKAELLARYKPQIERLEVEELGEVYVRSMSARNRDAIRAELLAQGDEQNLLCVPNVTARVVVATLCDADGNYVFRPEEADAVGDALPYDALNEIALAGLKVSGILSGSVEDEEKN